MRARGGYVQYLPRSSSAVVVGAYPLYLRPPKRPAVLASPSPSVLVVPLQHDFYVFLTGWQWTMTRDMRMDGKRKKDGESDLFESFSIEPGRRLLSTGEKRTDNDKKNGRWSRDAISVPRGKVPRAPPSSVRVPPPPPIVPRSFFPPSFFLKRKQREKQTHPKCPLTRPDHKESPLHPHVSFVSLADHVVIPHEERLNDRLLAYHLPTTLPSPPPLPRVVVIIE